MPCTGQAELQLFPTRAWVLQVAVAVQLGFDLQDKPEWPHSVLHGNHKTTIWYPGSSILGLQNTFPHLSPNVIFVAIHAPYIGRNQGSWPLAQDTAGSPSPDLSPPSEPCWLLLPSSLLHAGAGIHATGQHQAPSSHGTQVPGFSGKDSGCPAEGPGGSPLVGQEWVPSSLWHCP